MVQVCRISRLLSLSKHDETCYSPLLCFCTILLSRGFKQDCPDGQLSKEKILEMYTMILPAGNAKVGLKILSKTVPVFLVINCLFCGRRSSLNRSSASLTKMGTAASTLRSGSPSSCKYLHCLFIR